MDEMVVKLGVEQEDDDAQKKWCESDRKKMEKKGLAAAVTGKDPI